MIDDVNQPAHYNQGAIECIDALRAALTPEEFRGFLRGNVLKYMWRAGSKSDGVEDAKKAIWYARMLIGDDPRKQPAPTKVKLQRYYCGLCGRCSVCGLNQWTKECRCGGNPYTHTCQPCMARGRKDCG